MIGKLFQRNSFTDTLRYITGKVGAYSVAGNLASTQPAQQALELNRSLSLNPALKQPVYHISLSQPHDERLDDSTWQAIAHTYIARMGLAESMWTAYRHSDQEHDHIHIVASRIRFSDGKTVSDSHDYSRSQSIIREIEQQYGLTAIESSWQVGRRSLQRGELEMLNRTRQPSVRQQLQQLLERAIAQSETMPQLVEQLQQSGVTVQLSKTPAQTLGISFQWSGVALGGSQLGQDYSFNGLQHKRGIRYDPRLDNQMLSQLLNHSSSQAIAQTQAQVPGPVSVPEQVQEHSIPIAQQQVQQLLETAASYHQLQTQADRASTSTAGQIMVAWDSYQLVKEGHTLTVQEQERGAIAQSSKGQLNAKSVTEQDVAKFEWLQRWLDQQNQTNRATVRRRRQRELELG